MKKSTSLALAFMTLATTAASAADGAGNRAERFKQRFEKADANASGDITFEEFAAAMNSRITGADTDKDGKMTVGEIASEIDRMRSERRAKRIVERFDVNGDGVLTAEEIRSRQMKRFALLDRNDDGKLEPQEMPRGKGKRK